MGVSVNSILLTGRLHGGDATTLPSVQRLDWNGSDTGFGWYLQLRKGGSAAPPFTEGTVC
jgi:hypothetical protein